MKFKFNKFPGDTHLLGDKANPCTPQLMTPHKDNGYLTNAQRQYNFKLSAMRSTKERTFAFKEEIYEISRCECNCMLCITQYMYFAERYNSHK